MRFPAKKNAGCPKAPRDFPPRKDGILYPRPVVLGLPSPSHRVCADGRTYGCTDVRTGGHVIITSQPKFLGLIGYQISLAMELRWRALPAGSAIIIYIFLSSNRWHVLLSKFSQCRWPLGLEPYGASPLADVSYFLCFTNFFLAARLWWCSSHTRRQAFSCCLSYGGRSGASCHMRWGCEKFNFILKKVLHPVQSGRYHRDFLT